MSLEELGALDDEQAGGKAAEISDEVFRDQMTKTQRAIKAIKKAEKSARARDDQLAGVLMRFLQTGANSEVMLLVARCLNHNIPAGMLLGILALTTPEAREEFEKLLGDAVALLPSGESETALVEQVNFESGQLPDHVKKALDTWSTGLLEFGRTQPGRLLSTAVSPEGDIFPSLSSLMAVILRDYLASENIRAEIELARDFADSALKTVLTHLAEQLEVKKLS